MYARASPAQPPELRTAAGRPLKAGYTVFAGVVLGSFVAAPGPACVWFADVALLASVLALWYEHRLLASMTAIAVLVPALAWTAGFVVRLLGGADPFGLAGYLFDPDIGVLARMQAAVHVVPPALLLWLVYRLGYDARALIAQTLLAWAVLVVGVALAPGVAHAPVPTLAMSARLLQAFLPGWFWLALVLVAYPVLVYLPAHLLLQVLCGASRRRQPGRVFPAFLRLDAKARARPPAAGRGRARVPGRTLQARLRDLADFALVRRRRR